MRPRPRCTARPRTSSSSKKRPSRGATPDQAINVARPHTSGRNEPGCHEQPGFFLFAGLQSAPQLIKSEKGTKGYDTANYVLLFGKLVAGRGVIRPILGCKAR